MSADRHSDFGQAVQALMDGRLSIRDAHEILCYLCGYLEADEEFRTAFTKDANFHLKIKAEKAERERA